MAQLPYRFTAKEILEQGRTSQENVDVIKTWLSNLDDKTVPWDVPDELVVIFLLSCDNDIDLTKNTITMYYRCKRDAPEIFDDRDLDRDDIKKALDTLYFSSIPVRTDENYAVHYFKLKDTSYSNFELVPIMKVSYMLLDVTQAKNLPNGLVVVIDMKGFGLMHLTKLKIGALKKYFQFLQEGFPLQLKVIHILNAVYFFDKILNMLRMVVKGELIDLLKVHPPNLPEEKLFSLVPRKCLPAEYGGELESVEILNERNYEQLRERQEFWKLEEEMRKKSK